MNFTSPFRSHLLFGVVAATVGLASFNELRAAADPKRNNPAGKVYVADITGESQIAIGQKIEDLAKKSVYTVGGSIIETKANSTDSLVFSNGTGAFFDANTRVEIRRFSQEPFTPNRTDMDVEPSISQTQAFIVRGLVAICTSKLVAGSNMSYLTPLAAVNIRGRRLVIETSDEVSTISVLEGNCTVNGGPLDLSGRLLQAGDQAVIRRGAPGQPNAVVVDKIPAERLSVLEEKATMACNAKRTVYFETRDRNSAEPVDSALGSNFTNAFGGEDPSTLEVVAIPVVQVNLSPNITISPSTLPASVSR
jgi:hypothetical protein